MPTRLHPLTRSRRARRLAAGGLVLIALPVTGCGGDGTGGGRADADPAKVLPASSVLYGEITVRPEGDLKASVQALSQKIAHTPDPGAKIVAALDKAIKKDGATFKDDIDPWLGKKIGLALTGLKNPQSPDYAFVIDATDPKKALATLKKGEKGLATRSYKDVEYTFNTSEQQAAVTVGDTLTVGTENAVKAVIDVDKGGAALADSAKLKQARTNVTADGLGFFYADPAALIDLALSSNPALGAQAGQLKSLLGSGKNSSLGVALTTTANAIRLETATTGQKATSSTGDSAEALAGLPTAAVFAVGFGNIGATANQGLAQVRQLGGVYSSLLPQFKSVTGLDLEQDVLSWMGKGGLFVRLKGVTDVGGALVVETSDEKKTTAFIAAVERLIKQFGGDANLKLSPFSGDGAKGFQIATDQVQLPIIVATGGGKFVVAVGTSSLTEALKPTDTLGNDAQFKAIAAQLGTKPQFYMDLQTLVGFLDLASGSNPEYQKAKPYLQAFTALAAGSERTGTTAKSTIVIGVK